MEKIQTLFERDWEGDRSRVVNEVHPGCEWVLAGEGAPTRKYDGTCLMFDGAEWWARREVKDGKEPPPGFQSVGHDHITLKNIGWEPIEGSPFVKFWEEATFPSRTFEPGTYELIGPKINGNPEGAAKHVLIRHDAAEVFGMIDFSFEGIRDFLSVIDTEGIVFKHPDGRRMAKIKKRDFGFRR